MKKKILFINLDPLDVNYNHFLGNVTIDLFNKHNLSNHIITYENSKALKNNLGEFYSPFENIYGTTHFFSFFDSKIILKLIYDLIKINEYNLIVFHGRGYILYKLLLSEYFYNIKDKLIVFISHGIDFKSSLENIENFSENDFLLKINSIKKFYTYRNEFYTFPRYLFEKLLTDNISKNKSKFNIFIGGKSNRDLDFIKILIKKLNKISCDFEFFITSDCDFSDIINCNVFKYLQIKDFINILSNSNLNLILNKDLSINSGDTTLMLGYACGIPGITNTTNDYSKKYIKNNFSGFLIKNNNIDEIIEKIILIKENNFVYEKISYNSKKFFLEKFTTEKLVEKIFFN